MVKNQQTVNQLVFFSIIWVHVVNSKLIRTIFFTYHRKWFRSM